MKNRALVTLPVEEVFQTLIDLITYFQLPDAALEHEEKQIKLRSLKNRQNLFKQEVSSPPPFFKEKEQQYIKTPLINNSLVTEAILVSGRPRVRQGQK